MNNTTRNLINALQAVLDVTIDQPMPLDREVTQEQAKARTQAIRAISMAHVEDEVDKLCMSKQTVCEGSIVAE